jgi:hypothetical protein
VKKGERMSGFDIEDLLKFEPARHWCLNCLALWSRSAFEDIFLNDGNDFNEVIIDEKYKFIKCKICGVNYTARNIERLYYLNDFIDVEIGLPLKYIDNIVEHGKRLALISSELRTQKERYPPLRALLRALIEARSFVHFISWGISPLMIGALKVTAQRVPVRGIVSGNFGEQIMCEVNDFKDEAPRLDIKFCEPAGFRTTDIPHQKLVVIDSLLAFKGSANLSQTSWRSAAKGMEIIEVVSNIDEIKSLHNQFFSPIWGKMNDYNGEIEILYEPFHRR